MISFASDLQIFWPKVKWISALSLEAGTASMSVGSVRTFIAGMLGCHCGFGLICWESLYIFDSISCFEPVVRLYWISPFLRTERILFLHWCLEVPTVLGLHFPSIYVPFVWHWKMLHWWKISQRQRSNRDPYFGHFYFSFVCPRHLTWWWCLKTIEQKKTFQR